MLNEKWKKIVNSPEASAILKLMLHIHDLCDQEGDVSEYLPTLLHQVAQLLDVQTAAITVKDHERDQSILARYDRGEPPVTGDALIDIAKNVVKSRQRSTSCPARSVHNLLAVPIMKSNKVLGTFILANKSSGDFGEYDDIVVTLVESRVDAVIYDWLNQQEHLRVSTENQVIKELDKIREEVEDRGEALDRMITTLLESVNAQIGFISIYDPAKDRHIPGGKVIQGSRPMSNKDYNIVGKLIRRAKEEHQTIGLEDIPDSGIDSIIVVPLFLNGHHRFLGAMVLINKVDHSSFTTKDRHLIHSVTRIINNYIFQEEKFKRLMSLVSDEAKRDVEEELLGYRSDKSTGQRMEITMLFADIRNYSETIQSQDPTTTVRMLNDFFSAITPIIVAHGGTIDKFVGDEVVALFLHPTPSGSHQLMAVEAALAIQEELRHFNKEWELTGRPVINIGIGIHTGHVVLGQIGSYERKDFTAIGPNMNFAARLQSFAGPGEIIISEKTYLGLTGKVMARRTNPLNIKGFEESIAYHVEGHTPEQF